MHFFLGQNNLLCLRKKIYTSGGSVDVAVNTKSCRLCFKVNRREIAVIRVERKLGTGHMMHEVDSLRGETYE